MLAWFRSANPYLIISSMDNDSEHRFIFLYAFSPLLVVEGGGASGAALEIDDNRHGVRSRSEASMLPGGTHDRGRCKFPLLLAKAVPRLVMKSEWFLASHTLP